MKTKKIEGKKEKGFTLVEILIVVGVIFVLGAIVYGVSKTGNKSVVAAKETVIEDTTVGKMIDDPSSTFKGMVEGSTSTSTESTGN